MRLKHWPVDGDNRKSIVGSPHMVFAVARLLPVRLLDRLRRLSDMTNCCWHS